MKALFYPRLAWDGIRKNKQMVFPYVLTCICVIAMFYILTFLSSPETVSLLPRGGDTAQLIMILGCFVIAVFSMIFLFYTNSFLIRRRATEFGLYNVLGMDKGNLAKIMTLESLITSAISIISGLFVGITLSKLAELGLVKIIGGTITYSLRVDMDCVKITVFMYLAIFAIIWLFSLIRVSSSTTVSLLKSEQAGEKAPKANWFLGILGVVILGIAYYIAATIDNPIEAIPCFFLAAIMVIVATYLLMISGSVLLCRILQNNKRYYYHPRHFVSVSHMVYRMKRNGAGLASIAIIATMVLVMISAASCLWFGAKDMLKKRFPGDVNFTVRFQNSDLLEEENLNNFRKTIEDFEIENNIETETILDLPYVEVSGVIEENTLDLGYGNDELLMISKIREVCFIPLSTYNRQTRQNIVLDEGEALVFTADCSVDSDTIELISDDRTLNYRLVNPDESQFYAEEHLREVVPQIYLIISDLNAIAKLFGETKEDGWSLMSRIWRYSIDIKNSSLSKVDYASAANTAIHNAMENDPENAGYYLIIAKERETASQDFMTVIGSLFFIGIVLSTVFVFAAVLIIYYKQISEGYEDNKRFEVMRKVGMTREEIKRSINSQLLTVFFIPLVFAGVHLSFSFPMIGKLLTLFGLYNKGLFIRTTFISYTIFAVFYALVYKVTSNVYYKIVSDAKQT